MPDLRVPRRDFLKWSALGAAGLGLGGWAGTARATLPVPDRVFLITIDTLRADHLDFHGYVRPTTPFLSTLAAKGRIFDWAHTACNNTNPAHASLFTGLHIPQHGVMYNGQDSLSQLLYTLPELFHDQGRESSAFASVRWMNLFAPRYQHFQTYMGKYKQENAVRLPYYQANETIDNALGWLKGKTPDNKFLTWIHVYDPHDAALKEGAYPYHAPRQFEDAMRPATPESRAKLLDHWRNVQKKQPGIYPWNGDEQKFLEYNCGYDAEIAFVDHEIERYYRACEAQGLTQNSLWIFTSDHGEGLGSHGYLGHGMNIYQEQLHIPFFLHAPDAPTPARHASLVQHVDLFPTFLEWFGVASKDTRHALPGVSLLPLLDGRQEQLADREIFAMRRKRVEKNHSENWDPDPVYCVLDGKHKYIHRPEQPGEFYDLIADPREQHNLIAAAHPRKDALKASADAWYERLTKDAGEAAAVSDSYKEDLEALGYLGKPKGAAN